MKGDCLEKMKEIESGSVDAIITDPPYGTTACKWDSIIPFDKMWEQLNRIIKPNGAIVLFGSEPFSSALRMSNIKNYKYDWYLRKTQADGFLNAKNQPLREYELASVFNVKKYNPQFLKVEPFKTKVLATGKQSGIHKKVKNELKYEIRDYKYPKNTIEFKKVKRCDNVHPTQKPVALMEYLIKTYTNENETVLDFTMGSGTTGVACKNTNRSFIGIEMDDKYFEIAKERIYNIETTLLNTGEK
ncbi:site-specific DNA-methyltransferase [bacterium]|nr:site-specific DNA-methyltransferase [bacterium]